MNELYIQRAPTVAYRRLGGEAIVMSATDSTLYNLNEIATIIWEAADGHTPLSEIVQRHVCAEYDVEPEDALRDAQELVHNLEQHGILFVSGQPLVIADHAAAGHS
jgi:Coenzyme PQQ synthesis protein D (PqqD)